jgi:hypothetical protein
MTAIGGTNSDESKSLHDALLQLRERLNAPPSLPDNPRELPEIDTFESLAPSQFIRQHDFEMRQTRWFSWRTVAVGSVLVLTAALGSAFFFVDFDGIAPLQTRSTTGEAPAPALPSAKADRQSISELPKAVATRTIRDPDIDSFGSSPAFASTPDAPLLSNPPQQGDKLLAWPDPPQQATGRQPAISSSADAAAQAPSPAEPRQIDPTQAAALLQRAETLVANGDLTAARLILQRLAQAKNARAAYLLARTYDPAVMQELGIIGIKPEPEKAASWYDQARNWGFPESERRLQARSAAPATFGQR